MHMTVEQIAEAPSSWRIVKDGNRERDDAKAIRLQ
jgi:hypothetical protein